MFKFVAKTPEDVDTVADLADIYSIDQNSIWIMPEGATREDHLANLVLLGDKVVDKGYNLSTRLHVLVWDSKRGV